MLTKDSVTVSVDAVVFYQVLAKNICIMHMVYVVEVVFERSFSR